MATVLQRLTDALADAAILATFAHDSNERRQLHRSLQGVFLPQQRHLARSEILTLCVREVVALHPLAGRVRFFLLELHRAIQPHRSIMPSKHRHFTIASFGRLDEQAGGGLRSLCAAYSLPARASARSRSAIVLCSDPDS